MKKFLLLIFISVAALTFFACGKKDGAEKAGEKVDEVIEDTKDAVDNDGPVENAGEKVDDKLDGK